MLARRTGGGSGKSLKTYVIRRYHFVQVFLAPCIPLKRSPYHRSALNQSEKRYAIGSAPLQRKDREMPRRTLHPRQAVSLASCQAPNTAEPVFQHHRL